MTDSEAELARDLKVFRKEFRKNHGRDPSRKDMNKHPAIAATYDAWLKIKSLQSAASDGGGGGGSSSSSSSSSRNIKASTSNPDAAPKRKASTDILQAQAKLSSREASSVMAPPPTTPSKKKQKKIVSNEGADLFKTPTKRTGSSSRNVMSPDEGTSVHDSGGSLVDVPITPKQDTSPSLSRKRQSNQQNFAYESPSKLKDLLSSFSSIHRTPTKIVNKDSDAALMEKLRSGPLPFYTPRTKARKRLRGEVVITPEKDRKDQQKESIATKQMLAIDKTLIGQPERKRRRGMKSSTLRDFGIVSIAGPAHKTAEGRGNLEKAGGLSVAFADFVKDDKADESSGEDDEDDDMLGPSPSVNRVVNRPVKSFQSLFGVEPNNGLLEEEDTVADDGEQRDTEAKMNDMSEVPLVTNEKETRPAWNGQFSDDDDNIVVVPHQRFGGNGKAAQRKQIGSDDEDEGLYLLDAIAEDATRSGMGDGDEYEEENDDEPTLFHSLSLESPQGKRIRTKQRIRAEKQVRQLIGTDESLQPLDEWEESEEAKIKTQQALSAKSNKVGPAIKGGRLMKSAQDFKSVISKESLTKEKARAKSSLSSSSLVFSNLREQLGSDQDSDLDEYGNDQDDEWASDVGSEEYGLGNGYMSDTVEV